MKKINILLVAVFSICSLQIWAQKRASAELAGPVVSCHDIKSKLVFGFKAGLNRSNVFDEKDREFVANAKTGGVGGIFVAIPFGGFIGFQPELLLSNKGFTGTGVLEGQPYSFTRTSTYIDVPLQLQLKPFCFFSMVGGIQYSYLLRQKDEFGIGPNYEQINQEFKNDNIRKNIVGAVMGFDVNFWHIVLSGRAGWDMISNHGNGDHSTPRYKNLWLQATIGYRVY